MYMCACDTGASAGALMYTLLACAREARHACVMLYT